MNSVVGAGQVYKIICIKLSMVKAADPYKMLKEVVSGRVRHSRGRQISFRLNEEREPSPQDVAERIASRFFNALANSEEGNLLVEAQAEIQAALRNFYNKTAGRRAFRNLVRRRYGDFARIEAVGFKLVPTAKLQKVKREKYQSDPSRTLPWINAPWVSFDGKRDPSNSHRMTKGAEQTLYLLMLKKALIASEKSRQGSRKIDLTSEMAAEILCRYVANLAESGWDDAKTFWKATSSHSIVKQAKRYESHAALKEWSFFL